MPPRNADMLIVHDGADEYLQSEIEPIITEETHAVKQPPMQIVWKNIFRLGGLHLAAVYGFCLLPWAQPLTWLWTTLYYVMTALGITAGAHRLWSHKSYKAGLPLRIFLAMCNSMAAQNDIIEWCRDHRVHHKYSETTADPHDATRGFFFAHCGWLLVRKHPEVKAKGKQLDISDLLKDPVCAMQRKFYMPSVILMCFVVPSVVPWYFWGESAWNSYFICAIMRYVVTLNVTWLVNSWAHMYGNKPYDETINPRQNLLVTLGAIGEGYHNYHHTFPQDYSTSEYGWRVNLTTCFIDCMAMIGLAYDMKKMSPDLVEKRKNRTGDGSEGYGYVIGPKQE